jgi:hypothetical protein
MSCIQYRLKQLFRLINCNVQSKFTSNSPQGRRLLEANSKIPLVRHVSRKRKSSEITLWDPAPWRDVWLHMIIPVTSRRLAGQIKPTSQKGILISFQSYDKTHVFDTQRRTFFSLSFLQWN